MAATPVGGASLHRLFLAGMQPLTANTTLGSSSRGSMDSDMVIVLVALLCALIFAVGLNSFMRCVRSCNFPSWYSNNQGVEGGSASSAPGSRGSVLSEIPVIAVGSQAGISATDCSICLGEFLDCEKVRVLPLCKHGFHVNCIDTWLSAHSSCPLCRRPLLQQAPPPCP